MSKKRKYLFSIFLTSAAILLVISCKKNVFLEKPASNPLAVFDEAWRIMDERYSFFVLKNVDWKEQYDAFRPEINDQMTEKELFKSISDMLATVHDGHVS